MDFPRPSYDVPLIYHLTCCSSPFSETDPVVTRPEYC